MTTKKSGLSNNLVGKKVKLKYHHLWFTPEGTKERDLMFGYVNPRAEEQGEIQAAWIEDKEVKVLVSSEKGEIKTFFMEHLVLVTDVKKD